MFNRTLATAFSVLIAAAGVISCASDEPADAVLPGDSAIPRTRTLSAPATLTDMERSRITAYLAQRQDPRIVRKSIDDGGGEIVDCVDVHMQHGYENPIDVIAEPPAPAAGRHVSSGAGAVQAYGTVSERCPDGTVPQVRLSSRVIEAFGSLDGYLSHSPAPPRVGSSATFQYVRGRQDTANQGAAAIINYWRPWLDPYGTGEHSISQLWVAGGSGSGLQTVETGWNVDSSLYGDSYNHLFIFTTNANYASGSGCYNLLCSWFVQYSNYATPGGYIPDYALSTSGGAQAEREHILQRDSSGNWWFQWDGVWLGYWPASKYNAAGILNGASFTQFGGEVYNSEPYGSHTQTQMGSSSSPAGSDPYTFAYTYAAYQRNIGYLDTSSVWQNATGAVSDSVITDSYCYDGGFGNSDPAIPSWASYMFFGGPGYNSMCQ